MNLFLVTSPLQYLCADEAKRDYGTQRNVLMLVEPSNEVGVNQLDTIVRYDDWDNVIRVPRRNRSFNVPKSVRRVRSLLTKEEKVERFFFAEIEGWRTMLLRRNLDIGQHVYFDDGTSTLFDVRNVINTERTFFRSRFLPDLLVRLQGLEPTGRMAFPENFEIFSLFDLEECVFPVRRNTMRQLRERFGGEQTFSPEAPAGFVGQGSVAARGGPELGPYLDVLRRFKDACGEPVIYFPHRNEPREIREAVLNLGGITIHDSALPLEIELADCDFQLSAIGGMMSTALITLSILYETLPIHVARHHADSYRQDHYDTQGRVQVIADYYKRMNVAWF